MTGSRIAIEKWVTRIQHTSAHFSTVHFGIGDDYFSLDYGNDMFWRVDWILTKDGDKRVQPLSCQIVKDAKLPTYPSDHYPMVSEVRLIDDKH